MRKYKIKEAQVNRTLVNPDRVTDSHTPGYKLYQRALHSSGKVLVAVVLTAKRLVVTVYKSKKWKQ